MPIVDELVPAAAHLAGPDAGDVLRAALEPWGGTLLDWRVSHVQYHPQRDLAVRYDATVSWAGGAPRPETLLAGTGRDGIPRDTMCVQGTMADGDGTATIDVGVWRWPHDPVLIGLRDAVTPSLVGPLVSDHGLSGPLHVEVVAYRPMERAVARVTDERGRVAYVKALRPGDIAALVERHVRLATAGVPVAEVIATDGERGLVAFAELAGPTARQRYQDADATWPEPDDYLGLLAAIERADLRGLPSRPGRRRDAAGHAHLLRRVLPEQRDRLDRLEPVIAAAERGRRDAAAVHGDLYEAQLVTAAATPRIVGLLDLDDAGPGDPVDDRATVLAHLWSRGRESAHRARLFDHIDQLRGAFGTTGSDLAELDVATAACLIGLATGPFRIRSTAWRVESTRLLRRASQLVDGAGEKTLTSAPSRRHRRPA